MCIYIILKNLEQMVLIDFSDTFGDMISELKLLQFGDSFSDLTQVLPAHTKPILSQGLK